MARDDLNDPLGADAPAPVRVGRPWGWIAGGGLAVVAVSLGVFAWVTSDGMGGEPFAVARITTPPPAPPTPREPEARGAEATGTIAGQRRSMTAEEAEQASGVRVNRPGGAHAPCFCAYWLCCCRLCSGRQRLPKTSRVRLMNTA